MNRHDKLSRKWTMPHLYPNFKNKDVKYIKEFIAACHDYVGWSTTAVVSWIKRYAIIYHDVSADRERDDELESDFWAGLFIMNTMSDDFKCVCIEKDYV